MNLKVPNLSRLRNKNKKSDWMKLVKLEGLAINRSSCRGKMRNRGKGIKKSSEIKSKKN